MDDYAHPNDLGYNVMAQTFYSTLISILNPSQQKYSIAGSVLYYSNNNPINNVQMKISGGANSSVFTNSSGTYIFNNLQSDLTYLVQPAKDKIERHENSAITMYDAALTLRHAVGIEHLSSDAQKAADVDIDGNIIAYDAAMIARYVVELNALDNDHVGEWLFSPGNRNYPNLISDQNGENYTGILLGDVSGAWNVTNNLIKTNYELLSEINAETDQIIGIPISVFEDSLFSLFVELEFPSSSMKFESIEMNSNSDKDNLIYSLTDSRLKLGTYYANPQQAAGQFLFINFKTNADTPGSGKIRLKRMQINNYHVNQFVTHINIIPNENYLPQIALSDNYPNPFNPSTTIPYKITAPGHVKMEIYNLRGRQIKTIVDAEQKPGTYEIAWDGKNSDGLNVANGTYIYRIFFNGKIISKTMLKLN